jgi:putative intracellular protease/amidase
MRIAVALFEAVEELDFAGPWEVLAVWARTWPADDVELFTVAESRQPVSCGKGLRVLAERTWDELGAVDVLVYPGGRGVMRQLGDDRIRARLREVASSGTLMTSVCTGALAYATPAFSTAVRRRLTGARSKTWPRLVATSTSAPTSASSTAAT